MVFTLIKRVFYKKTYNYKQFLKKGDTMKYSDVILTDENFDEEVEKLAEIIGLHHTQYEDFVTKLDDKFKCQEHDLGFEEWVKQIVKPNFAIDCAAPIFESWKAYEFGNGFVIFYDRDSLWD